MVATTQTRVLGVNICSFKTMKYLCILNLKMIESKGRDEHIFGNRCTFCCNTKIANIARTVFNFFLS